MYFPSGDFKITPLLKQRFPIYMPSGNQEKNNSISRILCMI